MPEQVALAELHPEAGQRAGLVLGLDALRHEAAPGVPGEVAHPDHHRLASKVGIHPPHEADVELHEVGAQLDDVAEVGDPGARVGVAAAASLLRFSGPGRVGIQSLYVHLPPDN